MNTKIPESLQEVWNWKQKAFEKLQKVPREKWIAEIRKSTQKLADKLNKSVHLQHK